MTIFKHILIAALLTPSVSLAATTNLQVQAVVSGTLGGTTLTRVQVRLGLTLDTSQITGTVGSQTTPSLSGSATMHTGNSVSSYSLTAPVRISVNGATLSFVQDGGATVTVTNPEFTTTDLKALRPDPCKGGPACFDIPGSIPSGPLNLITSGGTLSIAEGARFSFHNYAVYSGGQGGGDLGGGTTITTSFKSVVATTNTSHDVETFLTRLTAKLNGGSPVYDQTFAAPFTDTTVQAAINQARAAITTAAGATPVTFAGPARTSTARTLAGSTQQTVDGTPVQTFDPGTIAIGPAFIYVGDNQATQYFVFAGNPNYDVLVISTTPRTIATTNTYLTSETYTVHRPPLQIAHPV